MITSIEDTIIAYFDRRLSDAESAELLHQVSVDPNSRRLFRQYEALRTRSQRARSAVVVYPQLESRVFSTIASIQKEETRRFASLTFAQLWKPAVLLAGTSLVVALLLYMGNLNNANVAVHALQPTSGASVVQAPNMVSNELAASSKTAVASIESVEPSVQSKTKLSTVSTNRLRLQEQPIQRLNPEVTTQPTVDESVSSPIATVNLRAARTALPQASHGGSEFGPIVENEYPLTQSHSNFIFSFMGASGSVNGHDLQTFGGIRADAGYFLTGSDIVGVRVALSSLRRFSTPDPSTVPLNSSQRDDANYTSQLGADLFFEHQEPVFDGRFLVTCLVAGGLVQNGNELSAEVGVKLPVSSHFAAGLSFALTRSHYNSVVAFQDSHDGPSSQNVLDTRIYYGMSYEF